MNKIKKQVYEYKLTSKSLAAEPVKVGDPKQIYDFLMSEVYDKESMDIRECFYAVFVDSAMNTKGYIKVSEGGVDCCPADAKIIFSAALKCLARAIVLTHNHPSGNLKPSEIDRQLTNKLRDGAKLLDMVVVDHIIVDNNRYYSFREHGEMN